MAPAVEVTLSLPGEGGACSVAQVSRRTLLKINSAEVAEFGARVRKCAGTFGRDTSLGNR